MQIKKSPATTGLFKRKREIIYEKTVKSARTLPTLLLYQLGDLDLTKNYKNINIYVNPVNYINANTIIILVNQIKKVIKWVKRKLVVRKQS